VGQKSAKGDYLALVPKIESDLDAILAMDSPSELDLAQQVEDAWAIAGPVGMSAIEAPPGSTKTSDIYPLEEFHPAMEEAIGLLGDLNEASLRDMSHDVKEIEARRTQLLIGLTITLLSALFGALVLSRRIRSALVVPL
jgi:hypothetical protein